MEDPAVGVERDHTLLDAGAGTVVEPDHRDADGGGQIHHLVDLFGEDLTERAAEDGEILAEHADPSSVDGAEPGDHPVGVGPVLLEPHAVGPVPGQHVHLLERAVVEQVVDALPGGHLAPGVVLLDRPGRPCVSGLLATLGQLRESLGHRVIHGTEATGPAPAGRSRLGRLGRPGETDRDRPTGRTTYRSAAAPDSRRADQWAELTQCGPHQT